MHKCTSIYRWGVGPEGPQGRRDSRVRSGPFPLLLADAHSPLGNLLQLLGHPRLVGPVGEKTILRAGRDTLHPGWSETSGLQQGGGPGFRSPRGGLGPHSSDHRKAKFLLAGGGALLPHRSRRSLRRLRSAAARALRCTSRSSRSRASSWSLRSSASRCSACARSAS